MSQQKKRRKLVKWGLLLAAAMIVLGGCSSNNDGNNAASNTGSNTETTDSSGNEAASSEEPAPEIETDHPRTDDDPEPQAGMLTAGEWDDLRSWNEWEQLANTHTGTQIREDWHFYRFDKLELKVTGGGQPAVDAEVRIIGENGQSVWTARTDAQGTAVVFPGLLDDQNGQQKVLVEVEADGQLKRFENVPIPRANVLKVDLDEAVDVSENLDVMFVVDTTGSMGDELNYLQTELKDVVQRVGQDNGNQLNIRVSTNFYRDQGDDYVVRPFPFTTDIDKAVNQLSQQEADGGGNFPEAVDEALADAIQEHEWSGEARARLMFLVLDAPPHQNNQVIKQIKQLTEEAAAEGIRIIPVVSSGADEDTEYLMRFISIATGGTYLFLTDHSGIGNDHHEPTVGEYEVRPLNELLVDVINRYAQVGKTN